MTTRVERVISEVIPQQDASESGEKGDERWSDKEKIMATMAHHERLKLRVAAEGFDD
ncbi:hypothetical protein [Desulfogranum marinum]|uniref:hypothetical protein n=1 Tax=Desulfogranum marinum TaxID=453220 RepID=UPI0029C6A704|nr:hypothetical protein [Desulfogranum marinum]